MSHVIPFKIDVQKVAEAGPVAASPSLRKAMWYCVGFGVIVFCLGLTPLFKREVFWGAYYTNLLFWMGLSVGGVMTAVIFQVVKAKWSPPVRRLAEANISFLPWAYLLLLVSYFGKEELFVWGRGPMPGREWWMEPCFVYCRYGVLLGALFLLLWRFVRLSLRSDVGTVRERTKGRGIWSSFRYNRLLDSWQGESVEIPRIQEKLSRLAPLLIFLYAIIYSLYTFDMVMGMDEIFFSNMLGGFMFIGNIYAGWAVLGLLFISVRRASPGYREMTSSQELHDIGKLTLGFCILWGYLLLAQFLPIWYGNLPEETQWVIVRMREEPWKLLSWLVLSMCFIIPFIILLSRDVKKSAAAFAPLSVIILFGLWLERYVVVMPQLSAGVIPFGILEMGMFVGFLGAYVLSIQSFLSRYPVVTIRHPYP